MSRNIKQVNGSPGDLGDAGDRDPLEELAAEFADRVRNGERVLVEDYARRYPELAEAIRGLFPTVVAMEQLSAKRQIASGAKIRSAPKQLGDYRILGEIARGGMGIVYEAEQVSLGRRVAVKVLPPHALRREKDTRRFEREAHTAASLHHSNIVPVFGVGEDNGQRYIVMQLIHGVGLDEILREIRSVVVENRRGEDASTLTTSRIITAKRSAAGLLESELKLNSTSVDANQDTVETPKPEETNLSRRPDPLTIVTPMGAEYFKNVARIGLQAAEALQYAHQNNTLHRDIKPGNLLLDKDGRVWIADFGLAKALQEDDVTCSGDIVGTMAYVAPERFQGKTTKASDIYSLGVTLHELLTLQKAFDGEDGVAVMNQIANEPLPSPRKINKAVPRDLETIVMKAASKDRSDRYRSAAKLAADLEAFLEYRPIEARRLSRLEHAMRWSHRNRGMSALGAAVLFLLATVFGLLVFGYRNADVQRQRAESTSKAAVGALDEIYSRFAPAPLNESWNEDGLDESMESVDATQIPISKDVALLLENLLEFYDELASQTEDSDTVTIKYIAANRRVGDINQRLGQLEDARLSYEAATKRISELDPAIRDTPTMRLETARVYNGMGLALSYDWRHSGERVDSHADAVAILGHPDATDEEKFELAKSLYLLHRAVRHRDFSRGKRRDQNSNEQQQAKRLKQAMTILQQLKQQRPGRADYDLLLARCLMEQGRRNRKRGTDSVNESQSRAIEILKDLVERFPDNPEHQYELGQAYKSIEWWASHQDHRSEAQLKMSARWLQTALRVTANLEIRHPNIPKYYLLKKKLHEQYGQVLRKQNKLVEAATAYECSILMQKMLIDHDEHPDLHRPWLHALEIEYAKALRDLGEFDQAKEVLIEAIGQLEQLVDNGAPEQGRRQSWNYKQNRERLLAGYMTLSNVLGKLDDDEAARGILEKAEKLGE